MSKKEFRSMKELMEEYFPRKVKLRKLKMETPGEFGSRIVAEILSSAKELLGKETER